MNRVFQIVEYGEKTPVQFTSKANSSFGVFRSFSKSHPYYLDEGTLYELYGHLDFGFLKLGAAFWNGKSFVKVSTNPGNEELLQEFISLNKDFKL